ncbi:MFS transporter [Synechococcales cyanobacterium C]|uniref:MFS transporter n=1 Tax=Petrachloros mirabilis ULC683 TaxID=2781853 RepID=A0A8K1ZW65_9CYAN|nr:MFS transporter [Petrachloros mirabilis]NCJ05251.1 MFS transporter [Petrachloros mirabilis ULC683]
MKWGRWFLGNAFAGMPQFDRRVWILSFGRLLSQVGIGFTLFYAPIFFVSQVGLSATQVGLGLGSGSISGVVGRVWGGTAADSVTWGRRRVLLISAAVSTLADLVLVLATDFPVFVVGQLLMGLGVGLYWPATEAMVADIVTVEQRQDAFAIVRLADSLGLGLGVIFGGILVATTGAYRLLFVIDGVTFLLFFGVIYGAIAETLPPQLANPGSSLRGWAIALKDQTLLIYVAGNILFTTYLAQVQSTVPLYLSQFVGGGLSEATLSGLFTGHVVLAALCQLPVSRALQSMSEVRGLMVSACLWGLGFGLVGLAGVSSVGSVAWAAVAMATMAIAMASYTPVASSLVVALAPEDRRGVYLSVNSLCWAFGYFIGPPLGGWALDQARWVADGFWVAAAVSVSVAIAILAILGRRLASTPKG